MSLSFLLKYKVGNDTVSLENIKENDDFLLEFSQDALRHSAKITAKNDLILCDYKEFCGTLFKGGDRNDRYFMNGYQSWTDTKEFYLSEKEHNVSRLPNTVINSFSLDRYGDSLFYGYKSDILHGYDIFYSKGYNSCFFENLNRNNAYLIFEINRKTGNLTLKSQVNGKVLKQGESFTLCDYCRYDSYESGIKAFKERHQKPVKKIFGYTSWYNYYQNINEDIILKNLEALDGRFNLFQIDDGFETFVGDWFDIDKKKFPKGLSKIVELTHEKGYLAGIWLAPFVAEEKSRIFREKPDWFKKDKNGNPVKCGSNWSGFYALDIENKEVKEHISKFLKFYSDMGFDFFKLDFLYGSNLPEYYGKTSCETANEAYSILREALGNKLILGCGATLLNSLDVFDYLRVGPDVSLEFDDKWYMKHMHRERISTKVTLQNTIYRGFLNESYFGNDPDVFLLRDDNISLSKDQRRALVTINSLFGSVLMTSDNIGKYDAEKQDILAFALELFQNGKIVSFERQGKIINIIYSLNGEKHEINYHTGKGVLL